MLIKRKFEFTDILGWSYTRYATFTSCKRKYFFDYYAKRDPQNIETINRLKRLTTIPLEIGNMSHKIIQRILTRLQKTNQPIDAVRLFEFARREALDIFKKKTFEEIYYRDLPRIDFDTMIYPKVESAIANFLMSDRFTWLTEVAIASKDDWYIPTEDDLDKDFGECRIDNQKAYCKVDFMFPIGDELHILDWKTGKQDYAKHGAQLIGYAGWANFHFGNSFDKIKPFIAYLLPVYNEHSVMLNEIDIEDFSQKIRRETAAMYEYCEVPEMNLPVEKERFELIESVGFCKYCKYGELCKRR